MYDAVNCGRVEIGRLRRALAGLPLPRTAAHIEGTLIRLQVDYLPGDRDPEPVWLWFSRAGAAPGEVDRLWQAFWGAPQPDTPGSAGPSHRRARAASPNLSRSPI